MDQLTERNEQEKSVQNKDKGTDWFFGNIRDAAQFLTGCWMLSLIHILPCRDELRLLPFHERYHG